MSIVLPTKDRKEFIEACVESCLRQTYPNLELVVVDDSTDGTSAILERMAERDPRLRVFRGECRNLPDALNYGFRWTRGDYLTWMCDDDLYEPEAIAIMARALDEHPEVGMVYCDLKFMDEKGTVLYTEQRGDVEEMDRKSVAGRCILYRRAVYARLGDYSLDDYLNEDDEYWLRVRDHFKILHLPVAPYRDRLHDGSLTEVKRVEALLAQFRTWAKRAPTAGERRRILGEGYLRAANLALYRRGKRAAFPLMLRGMANRPTSFGWLKVAAKMLLPLGVTRSRWEKARAVSSSPATPGGRSQG